MAGPETVGAVPNASIGGDSDTQHSIPELVELAGSQGVEIVNWLAMRGALGGDVVEVHRYYHIPISNTAAGLLALEPTGAATGASLIVWASTLGEKARRHRWQQGTSAIADNIVDNPAGHEPVLGSCEPLAKP